MITIITYGTFDLLHIGHINLFANAKKLGDKLIVGLSTDEFNQQKNKDSFMDYEHRKIILQAIKYVDVVIPETCWEQKSEDIEKNNVDILVMGDDWKGKFDHLRSYCRVVYLPRTPQISSTLLRNDISIKFDRHHSNENREASDA